MLRAKVLRQNFAFAPYTEALYELRLCVIIGKDRFRKEFLQIMLRRNFGRRLTALLLICIMLMLSGCHSLMEGEDALETKYITTTFYPLYAIALNITQDVPALSLNCLIQPQDGCIRSYELSDWDYSVLLNQDAVIMGGHGLEGFEGTLMQLSNQPILLTALEGVHLREETAGNADDENTAHFLGENPWAFLSVAGAMEISISLAAEMAEIDELFAEKYHENLTTYLKRLETLVGEMSQIIAPAPYRPVAVLHEGLTYFAQQFGMNIALVYPREPGSDVIDNDFEALLEALEESEAQVIFIEEQAPARLVDALEEAGYPVALLDTLTAHAADGDAQIYEQAMLENAQTARDALERAR